MAVGFDAPCAHNMYTDKPMKGHGLMQAIARVNRAMQQIISRALVSDEVIEVFRVGALKKPDVSIL